MAKLKELKEKCPEMVPVFDKSMIRKFAFGYGTKCRCSYGWISYLFGNYQELKARAINTLSGYKNVKEAQGAVPYTSIPVWNDHDSVSKKEIADTLNRLMRDLGYTEIEEVD